MIRIMERSDLKRSSSDFSDSSVDPAEWKRARQDEHKEDERRVTWSQSTVEYELSQELSQGDAAHCRLINSQGDDQHRNVCHTAEKAIEDGDSAGDAGMPDLFEDEQDSKKTTCQSADTDISSVSPRLKWKDTSLVSDADTVTAIIPSACERLVFDTLAKHRGDPNRLDIVTATVLDSKASTATTSGSRVETVHEAGAGVDRTDPGSIAGTSSSASSSDNGQHADTKKMVSKVKAANPDMQINAAEVFTLLEKHKDRADRVHFVADCLPQNGQQTTLKTQASLSDDIFTQAMKLNTEFPDADPSAIYDLLENAKDQANRLQLVRETLANKTGSTQAKETGNTDVAAGKPALVRNESIADDPLVRTDPVYRDMRIISKMFPEKDQNEIYALVEAHYYKPDRVQVVVEELLRSGNWSQGEGESQTMTHSQSADRDAAYKTAAQGSMTPHLVFGDLQDDVQHLLDVFPDCDPNFIYERLETNKSSVDRVRILASEMFEKRDYPKLKEMVERQTRQARKNRLHRLNFTTEEFLAKFPDPSATFYDDTKEMKDSYKAHVAARLKHDFPDFKMTFVKTVIDKHNGHYLSVTRELETTMADILANGGRSKKLRKTPREKCLSYPDGPDEYFFYELWYSRNEQKVQDYFEEKKAARNAKVEAARAQHELYECGCCFEDECLFEEMNACADGHLFCRQCIARSAEAAFGEGKTTFPCLTGTCEHQIPLSVLKDLLPAAMFSKMLRKMQEEEVRQAGITDLVDCPFCSFATIMADPEDKVFRCLNPECLKDSCRLCQEPNHVPLKCEEVEKQTETDMRTFIEKRVTEAMIRKCHRCKKHFVKDMGCNKMTCVCGATSCYICREPDIDYEHFNNDRCADGNMEEVHKREMEEAAGEAREEYLRDHPEAADINLKCDPVQHINTGAGGDAHVIGHLKGGDEDDYDEDDDGYPLEGRSDLDESFESMSEWY